MRTKKALENLHNFKTANNTLRDEVIFLKSDFENRFNHLDTNLNKINGLVNFIRQNHEDTITAHFKEI
jgi:hypothetical protein